ncbi:DUF808 domain-containing protein [Corynebacterium uberis]|uniref:DUF808 domain-containing protein n=1 Tax=Corynebacterium TaxID=1716 RepID=UPI001D0A08AC|nr:MULTISPECIES: DUF808 domain-containing protein [Corynebacterium]MCZ9308178.1 DUF808 domain-containing protein [Corynebacterium sp. c6VSa_13]UDL73863.1 DUF808 domain-containing protein [Corynebacterium uberis]UDL75254.1 DUF808 domain-containing protein [Corynebacterium uberis]UDL77465.1 DUF808 domain-containing protein [Corynebacterium uberis]UDL79751.1 DUF808 domain-containing protein [Corynebacterium uberis]
MAGGLAALLDDVALIARKAAIQLDDVAAAAGRTSTKAVAVVVDDAAVTPGFVSDLSPARELPVIWKITKGSLVNKLLIILPIALLLSWAAPWALTPILMVGGAYLSYEGAEKIWEYCTGHGHGEERDAEDQQSEKSLVSSAIRTDLILSAEIMVLSLNEVTNQPFLMRTAILVLVGILLTFGVYGVVGALIKMDDIGLALKKGRTGILATIGHGMIAGMPIVLSVLSVVGTAAMLWVGGHILLNGVSELGWHGPFDLVHHLAHRVEDVWGGPVWAWLVETACSAVVGFLVGSVILGVVTAVARLRHRGADSAASAG